MTHDERDEARFRLTRVNNATLALLPAFVLHPHCDPVDALLSARRLAEDFVRDCEQEEAKIDNA